MMGQKYFVLTSVKDIIDIAKIVEKDRAVAGTNMNQTSSRSHAVLTLTLWRLQDGNVYKNHVKFVDLCGSERLSKNEIAGAMPSDSSQVIKIK